MDLGSWSRSLLLQRAAAAQTWSHIHRKKYLVSGGFGTCKYFTTKRISNHSQTVSVYLDKTHNREAISLPSNHTPRTHRTQKHRNAQRLLTVLLILDALFAAGRPEMIASHRSFIVRACAYIHHRTRTLIFHLDWVIISGGMLKVISHILWCTNKPVVMTGKQTFDATEILNICRCSKREPVSNWEKETRIKPMH